MSSSPFGSSLQEWRHRRGVSQLELSGLAETTSRHVSFLETGRSRPGREMVLRLSKALELPRRECNALLLSAGLPPEFGQHGLEDDELRDYRRAIGLMLAAHEPLPGCVVDRWGQVLLGNETFEQMNPGWIGRPPEELFEFTFGAAGWRDTVPNWAELAWVYLDRMKTMERRTGDARFAELGNLVRQVLGDTPRPDTEPSAHITAQVKVGDLTLSLFTTFVRFENARDITLSELTVELIFPADEVTTNFFAFL